MPWRIAELMEKNKKLKEHSKKRNAIFKCFYRGILDHLFFISFAVLILIYFFRWKYVFYAIFGILKKDKKTQKPNRDGVFEGDSVSNSI